MTTDLGHLPWAFVAGVALLFGCLVGSFLNVVIYRLPRGESIVWPGSHCPRCAAPLHWWENIPLVSFTLLRGRCRTCRESIPWRYPLVEAMTGALWLALALREGVGLRFLAETALVSALVAIFWIDLDTMLILDAITWPGIALGIAYSAGLEHALIPHLLAAIGGYLFFRLIEWGSERALGVAGMGRGDAKLAALMGAWLGPAGLAVGLMVAFVLGSAIGLVLRARAGESRPFPFGPSMVLGALTSVFGGQAIWGWYLRVVLG